MSITHEHLSPESVDFTETGTERHRIPGSAGIWSRPYLPVTLANLVVVALVAFDALAVVAALPSMAEELGHVAWLPWVITAYVATSGVAGIVAGPLIDAVGVRRMFRWTGTWFIVANAAGVLAPSMPLLVLARVGQGVGGGLLFAVAVSAIGLTYPPELRARAFAANSVVWGVLGLGSPAFAGVLLATASWRFIFAIQIPLTALTLAIGWNALPRTRKGPEPLRMDWGGALLLAGLLAGSLLAVGQIGVSHWGGGIGAAVAAMAGAGYWWHSGRINQPILARPYITRPPLRWIHLTVAFGLAAGLAANNFLPLYVQTTRGRSVEFGAFSLIFLTVGWTLGSVVFSTLLTRWREADAILLGAKLIVPSIGLAGIAIALEWPLTIVFVAFSSIGLSIGMISTASLTLIQATSGRSEIGRVNAAHQFVTSLGLTYGMALGGAVLLLVVSRHIGDVEAVRGLVAGGDPALHADTSHAIGRGMAWVMAISGVIAIGSLLSAKALARQFTGGFEPAGSGAEQYGTRPAPPPTTTLDGYDHRAP